MGGSITELDRYSIWMDGVKITVADIDAPETRPLRCLYEADLGDRATTRLHELFNEGPIELQSPSGRGEDRSGNKLRVVREMDARLATN